MQSIYVARATTKRFAFVLTALTLAASACAGEPAREASPARTSATTPTIAEAGGHQPTVGVERTGPTHAVASGAAPAKDAAGPGPAVDGGLYVPPNPLPAGAPGDVIAAEPLTPLDTSMGDAHGQRFLYHSLGADGGDIAVSGLVLIPGGEPPKGGWPVVAWAHGTVGVADVCAPSRWADLYEYGGYLATLTRHGYVVVATDYEGLGTPGPHRYHDIASEARGMADSVAAVHQLVPDTTKTWVSMGHSQGGQAALGAAQHAGDLKGFPLIGTVAIAPSSSLRLFPALASTEVRGYLAFVAAGVVASDPTVTLDDLLGPAALAHRDVLDTGCWTEVMDAFASVAPEQMLPPGPTGQAALNAFLDRNEPGTSKIAVPVLLVQGEADDSVPPAVTALLRDHLCTLRDVVALRTYPGLGHDEVLSPSLDDTAHWIADRFAGTPAVDECAAAAGGGVR